VTDAERQIIEDYKAVFGTDSGRRVLEHMKVRAGVNWCRVSKVAPIEANRVIWNESQRAFVLGTIQNVEFDFTSEPVKEEKE